MNRFKHSKLFFWTIELLAIFLIFWVGTQISFLFHPVAAFVSVLFTPILIAGFLYYLMNPMVGLLEKLRMKRIYSILLLFALILVLVSIILTRYIPVLIDQINQMILYLPDFLIDLQRMSTELMENAGIDDQWMQQAFSELNLSVSQLIRSTFTNISSGISSFIGVISRATIVAITVPIILFFMLKEGDRFSKSIARLFPENFRDDALELLHTLNKTLSSYITGQATVCLYVAVFTTLGYSITGMPYALLLGSIAGLTDIIPYVGPWLGIAPALIISLSISPLQALLVILVVVVVQIGESNVVSPYVLGKHLNVHPLTIILLLLVAGNLAGLMGMILGIPFYAISKQIIIHLYGIYQQYRKTKIQIPPSATDKKN